MMPQINFATAINEAIAEAMQLEMRIAKEMVLRCEFHI